MDAEYFKTVGVKVIGGIAISLLLILSDGMGWIEPVYSVGNYMFEPMAYWTSRTVGGVENIGGTFFQIGSLRSDNAKLLAENAGLVAQVGKLSEVQRENEILRSQLGIELTKDWNLKKVRILGIDRSGVAEHVIIDGGSDDGIVEGDIVILGDLLIGEVRDVFRSTARVRLVSNRNSNIYAIDQKTGAKGLVRGSLDGIVMEEVLENEKLEVGDVVITWDDEIPGGLVIGSITKTEEVPTSSTKTAFIETGFSLEDVYYVFVVLHE